MSYLDNIGLSYFWTKVKTLINNHINNKSNPHAVTKAQVGLSEVTNTSDSNKPVSVPQRNALNLKVDKEEGKGLSTNDYTTAEKSKLASLGGQGTYYDHPHPAGGTYNANDLTQPGIHRFIGVPKSMVNFPDSSVMSGDFDMVVESGLSGAISQTIYFTTVRYYKRMYNSVVNWGAWETVMYLEPDQYTKLTSVETGANKTVVDSGMSSTSINPVQNKVVYSQLSGKLGVSSNATSASKLYTKRSINGLYFDGSSSVSGFGMCTTASATVAKTIYLQSVTSLNTGCVISLTFQYSIDIDAPTLNVSNTGAKPMYYNGKPISAGAIMSGMIVDFVYYNNRWNVIGSLTQSGVATSVFESLDFNKYILPGSYVVHRNGETFLNGPGSQLTGYLEVKVNQGLITQTYTDYTGRLINIRGCYNNTWYPWVTYSGAFSPTVGGALNFVGNTIISRNLSEQHVIGNRCFADISFQVGSANIGAGGILKFTNYYTPTGDFDGRFLILNGSQVSYSVSTYTNTFTLTPSVTLGANWWVRGQISYQTDGTIHA